MIPNDQPQSNSEAIEALKAATRQVVQPTPSNDENPRSPTAASRMTHLESMPASKTFTEAFVRKITSVEQEKAKIEKEQLVVEQELARVEKLQLSLTEKKKQLENRTTELIKVKDKLEELDKEMSDVLKFPSP
jgi:predicted transcriptional regulator